ncbi:AAA domain-containing protein [Variovorax boronicumulans]|uniref:AAA domain-containing protein n=1 Tax=Variovorax boronicumulans TaxID=436515 RepID=UPI001F0AE0D4|nr:AAA domain-containing protein [Variovorax boronicumulans]
MPLVSIYVCGEDRTRQIRDWTIRWSEQREVLELTCHFLSNKKFARPLSDCRIDPTRELSEPLLREKGSSVVEVLEKAVIYGDKYAVIQYPGRPKTYVRKLDGIEFVSQAGMKGGPIFRYFVSVAESRMGRAKPEDQTITSNVVRQLGKLPDRPGTALHAYCTGTNVRGEPSGPLIYPFGVNESQLMAVEQAFNAQISLIEGPPGTGKTQTILNIIANVLLRGETVAVLSNNNAAVKNVYEKLQKSGLDYLVARLGSKDNRKAFFADIPALPKGEPEVAPTMEALQATLTTLKQHLRAQSMAAQLRAEIDELRVEQRHLLQWQQENGMPAPASLEKYGLSPRKTADLMAYLSHLAQRRVGFKDRIELLFNFKIFRAKPFGNEQRRRAVFHALQLHYYEKLLKEKKAALAVCRESLERASFTSLLQASTAGSMGYLKRHLHESIPDSNSFEETTYRNDFDAFLKRFPIIGSGTHSIVNSMKTGAMLDYVIIDEASQQDIVPGILALGCARNLVVVGDRKQLAHIPVKLGLAAPDDAYDCERYSLLDSCIGVFQQALPRTLLKEHYRCHPRIIQFCNQQFYENELIPMTHDGGEEALSLLVTAKGNHAQGYANLRELDSLLKVLDHERAPVELGDDGRGFIAPFRAQVVLSGECLPEDFVKDTVHKFQGRECDEIVFSTVLDKKRASQARLDFVDDARMVNVAVSRAKNRFTLVTGDDVFGANNGPIAALLRYVEYYADKRQIRRAPVVSAFDLLYREYDQSLERLNARLRPADSRFKSEQIVAQLLREAMSRMSLRALMFHCQISLSQLASSANTTLTERELAFMRNGASCDFVLYFKVGKTPLGVIEVDGGSHDTPEQIQRDALKNSILKKSNIPLLRLRTVESRIEDRIAQFLANWAARTASI